MAVVEGVIAEPNKVYIDSGKLPYTFDPLNPANRFLLYGESLSGESTKNPTPMSANVVSGVIIWGLEDEIYNRLYVLPTDNNLGYMSTTANLSLYVWNAYKENKTLTSYTPPDRPGSELSPVPQLGVYLPTELKNFDLNIASFGDSQFTYTYTFTFGQESAYSQTTGVRQVIWSHIPEKEITETLNWKTNIIQTYSNEQRISLTKSPRLTLKYDHILEPDQYVKAKRLITNNRDNLFLLPYWLSAKRTDSPLIQGTTDIDIETSDMDIRISESLLIYKDEENYEAKIVSGFTSNSISLSDGISRDYPSGCLVAPAFNAYARGGITFNRSHNKLIESSINFEIEKSSYLTYDLNYPTYRSRPVMTDRTVIRGEAREEVSYDIYTQDNSSSKIESILKKSWSDTTLKGSVFSKNKADKIRVLKWLHDRQGRFSSFWMPSFNDDFILASSVSDSDLSINVKSISADEFISNIDIAIFLQDQVLFIRPTSISSDGVTDVLSLETPIGVSFSPSDVVQICQMFHCRLSSDRIQIRNTISGFSYASFNLMVVPE